VIFALVAIEIRSRDPVVGGGLVAGVNCKLDIATLAGVPYSKVFPLKDGSFQNTTSSVCMVID
jgi:hypothetical protein